MAYIVKWREHSGDSPRQQVCATLKEAEEWRGAVKAMGGVDLAILPQTYRELRRPKQIQIIDPEGRVWDPRREKFQSADEVAALAAEVNALLRK
jgi:hypothetical protein